MRRERKVKGFEYFSKGSIEKVVWKGKDKSDRVWRFFSKSVFKRWLEAHIILELSSQLIEVDRVQKYWESHGK